MPSGFSYIKAITVTGSADGAQTNIPHRITVFRKAGSDSGDTVYLGTHCNVDFSDLRFTNVSGTELGYWREPYRDRYPFGANTGRNFYGTTWRCQSFKADHSGTVTGVYLWVKKTGNPSNLIVRLRSTNTGSNLASVTVNAASIGTSDYVKTLFTFDTAYAVTGGTAYYIVFSVTGDASNYIDTSCDDTTPLYPDGCLWHSGNGGSSFSQYVTENHLFEVQYDSVTVLFNLDSVPASPSTATFYIYYGNSSAATTENITGISFLGETMASTPSGSLAGNAATYLPYVQITPAVNSNNGSLSYTASHPAQYEIVFMGWTGNKSGGADALAVQSEASSVSNDENAATGGYSFVSNEYLNYYRIKYNGTDVATYTGGGTLGDGILHRFVCQVLADGSSARLKLYRDGTLKINTTTANVPAGGNTYFYFNARTGGANNIHAVGWFYFRKTTLNEPTISAWGNEGLVTAFIGQTKRGVNIGASFSGQSSRAIKNTAAFAGQTARRLGIMAGYAAQTLREVSAESSAYYDAQLLRIVTKATRYTAQAVRIVNSAAGYNAQTRRVAAALAAFIGQTRRIAASPPVKIVENIITGLGITASEIVTHITSRLPGLPTISRKSNNAGTQDKRKGPSIDRR